MRLQLRQFPWWLAASMTVTATARAEHHHHHQHHHHHHHHDDETTTAVSTSRVEPPSVPVRAPVSRALHQESPATVTERHADTSVERPATARAITPRENAPVRAITPRENAPVRAITPRENAPARTSTTLVTPTVTSTGTTVTSTGTTVTSTGTTVTSTGTTVTTPVRTEPHRATTAASSEHHGSTTVARTSVTPADPSVSAPRNIPTLTTGTTLAVREDSTPRESAQTPSTTTTAVSRCVVRDPPWRIEMSPGALRPVQLVMAVRGDEALALVTLTRPTRDPREGLTFPESRIVHIGTQGPTASMVTPGFEPDAALAWHDGGTIFVTGYTRPDLRGDAVASQRMLTTTTFTLPASHEGRVEHLSQHTIDDSMGRTFDARPIPEHDGFVTLISTPVEGEGMLLRQTHFSPEGEIRGHAMEIARDSSVASTLIGSRFRASLVDVSGQLVASWMAARGGVWLRRMNADVWDAPAHRPLTNAWSVESATHGEGFFVRVGTDSAEPTALHWMGWTGEASTEIARGWDMLAVTSHNHAVVVGTVDPHSGESGHIGVGAIGQPLTSLPLSAETQHSLASAVDVDMVPTTSGALVGWIEPAEGASRPVRHVAFLRIQCE